MTFERFRDTSGLLWAVVMAEPNREQFCRDSITRAGLTAWWPHYVKLALGIPGKRQHEVKRGLFPGYLFAGIEQIGEVGILNRTEGVATVCRNGGQVALIPLPVFNKWRSIAVDDSGLCHQPNQANAHHGASYRIGDRIRLTGAQAFAGFLAQVRHVSGSRIDAELDDLIFGRRVKLSVDSCQVEKTI